MWTAKGTLDGLISDLTLVWDGGLLDWPADVLLIAAEAAAAGTEVVITAPNVRRPLNLDDELAVAFWLRERGMTLTGDLPKAPAVRGAYDPDLIY
ncbi:hypothetical protein [Parafrankia sp. EUN1f]|uniref:hypothetical protein n=1 Tax=Parafrankia sp. EUN1f TaxID=102897 RepID=UPI0001C46D0C|nr:hypothetical protein [Parafrankia sp. EUN1f]EFC80187.1 hypothetical protein FrEUN1fDRAFT_6716 [Parafrankia sp. EUN1f]